MSKIKDISALFKVRLTFLVVISAVLGHRRKQWIKSGLGAPMGQIDGPNQESSNSSGPYDTA
jgi:hypothetical protein